MNILDQLQDLRNEPALPTSPPKKGCLFLFASDPSHGRLSVGARGFSQEISCNGSLFIQILTPIDGIPRADQF
jgi:hypothetical protein